MTNGQNDDARKDFLVALAVTAAISAAIIIILDYWRAGSTISQGGRYALWGTFAALILKMLISDWGNKKFEWHKHGYDMCIMTLGTSLTTLAYELSKDEWIKKKIIFLGLLFLGSMAATLLAGGNSRSIEASAKAHPAVRRPFLEWTNIVLGTVAIGLNLYILVVKDVSAVKRPEMAALSAARHAGLRR